MWTTHLHPDCELELKELNTINRKLVSKVIFDFKLLQEFGLDLMEEERVKKLNKRSMNSERSTDRISIEFYSVCARGR